MTTAVATGTPSFEIPHSSSNDVADIACIVELAVQSGGVARDPEHIFRSATRSRSDLGVDHHAFVPLAATCGEHGLSCDVVRATGAELLDQLDDGVTLVLSPPSGLTVIAAPTGGSPTAYRIHNGAAAARTHSARRVLDDLGDGLHDALVIEARYPLDVLGNLGNGPGGAFKKLITWARSERGELMTVVIYAALIGLLTLVVPVSVQALVNTIAFGSMLQPLVILGIALSAGLMLSASLQALRHHAVEVLQQRIFASVVSDFGRRIPRWASTTSDPREMANRFFDVVTFQKSFATLSIDALGLSLQIAVGLLLLAFYHPVLLAFDVVLVATLAALTLLPLRLGAETAMKESKAKYATAAWLQALAETPAFFGTGRGGNAATARADALSRNYLHLRSAHWRRLLIQIAGGLGLHVVASVALLLIGGWLVMERQLTLGQLVAAELVVAVIGAGLAKLGKQMEKLYDAAAAIDKISQVVTVDREREGGQFLRGQGPMVIHAAQVASPRLARTMSFTVDRGATVAVVGPAGSGKTTLLSLIHGTQSCEGGRVSVDGVDIEELDLHLYRDDICWLDDSGRTPPMTIAELLRLHAPNASTTAIREVLTQVGLSAAVNRLPGQLDEPLSPAGAPLSRGEMLRLHVARLLLQKPRLALIDGTLDQIDDDPALLDQVLSGPWTTLVATRSPQVVTRTAATIDLHAPSSAAPEEASR